MGAAILAIVIMVFGAGCVGYQLGYARAVQKMNESNK